MSREKVVIADLARINPYRRFFGSMVPEWLARRPEISPGPKLAYARLARYARDQGVAWPHLCELGEQLGVGEEQAGRYVRELAKHALIHIERQGLSRPNRYHFLDHPWITDNEFAPESVGSGDDTSVGSGDGRSVGTETADLSSPSSSSERVTEESHSSSRERDPGATNARSELPVEDRFEIFWESWPKRAGRRLYKSKALAIWKRLPLEDQRLAVKGARRYAAASAAGAQGAMDAFRWLRDQLWTEWQDDVALPVRRRGRAGAPDDTIAQKQDLEMLLDENRMLR